MVFCVSDEAAPSVYEAAALLDLKIPGDLSVIGFGNLPISAVMHPPLTSVEQFPEKVGRTAANLLLKAIEAKGAARQVTKRIATQVVIRASLGSAPAA